MDLPIDLGLIWLWITFPCSEWTAASIKTFILILYDQYTDDIDDNKMELTLKNLTMTNDE
jgi:hypothetical protein